MNWEQLLTSVRDAYRNAPDGNQPISQSNYLALLGAFAQLVPVAQISSYYETDFRRNMPGGSGRIEGTFEQVVGTLEKKVTAAATFAHSNPLYPTSGEGIAENLRAIIRFAPSATVSMTLTPIQPVLKSISDGNL